MTSNLMVIGNGVLADTARKLLLLSDLCKTIRMPFLPSTIPLDVDLALVLDDAWHPPAHSAAEETFRSIGIPWLRGYVAFGNGFVGPLSRPGKPGCSCCADLRMLMAEPDRREMLRLQQQFSDGCAASRDSWATRSGLLHMAHILVAEIEKILHDVDSCQLLDHVVCTNLKTLETTRHFILPNAACPVCGSMPEDSAEAAVVQLKSSPKVDESSFRTRSLKGLEQKLIHDYLDGTAGLLNQKVQDLITPFAAVSVNLPLPMGDEGTSGRAHSYQECEPIAI